MSSKKPVVAAPVDTAASVTVLTGDQSAAAFAAGAGEAKTSLDRLASAEGYARALGSNPTFLQWESMRAKWVLPFCRAIRSKFVLRIHWPDLSMASMSFRTYSCHGRSGI